MKNERKRFRNLSLLNQFGLLENQKLKPQDLILTKIELKKKQSGLVLLLKVFINKSLKFEIVLDRILKKTKCNRLYFRHRYKPTDTYRYRCQSRTGPYQCSNGICLHSPVHTDRHIYTKTDNTDTLVTVYARSVYARSGSALDLFRQ